MSNFILPAHFTLASELINPAFIPLHIANFIVLAFVLKWLLYKPVQKLMKKRDEIVAIQEKKLMEADADIARKKAQLEMDIVHGEQKIHDEQAAALADINKKANAIITKAQEEAQSIIGAGRANVDRERQAALTSMDVMISELAVDIAGKLIKSQLTKEEQLVLIKEGIKEAHGLEK